MKRSFLLMIAAVAIAFAGVGSYVGWQVDAQEGPPPPVEICNNGINDNPTVDSKTDCVLILGTTVTGSPSPEQVEAEALGFEVHVDNAAAWGARSTASFASYRAIILGDPDCSTVASLAPAEGNRTTWTPAVTGNVVVIGTDPSLHSDDNTAGTKLTANGINFAAGPLPAAGTTGKTGAYITLSCYYYTASSGTPVPVLDQFGSFTVVGQDDGKNDAHIVDTAHPVVNIPYPLSDADLSNWGNSIHERFVTWPGNFTEVAEQVSDGKPYIIARAPVAVDTSLPKPFSPTQTTGTFTRTPGEGVYAKLTFLGQVLEEFEVQVVFVTVNQATEDARLDLTIFSATETCIPSNLPIDGGGCIRYTFRKVGGGVPQQGVDFTGDFRVELAFHADFGDIGSFDIAHAITGDPTQVESGIDLYDEKIAATLSMASCNCVGVGETDSFSDFLPITEPVSSPDGVTPFYTGPLSPIRADGTSVIKAGRALPVKFSLVDVDPLFGEGPITDAIAVLGIKRLVALGEDTLNDYEEILVDVRGSATSNEFTSTGGGIYHLVVDTKGWLPGLYTATITFKKNEATGNGPYLGPQLFYFAVK